MAKRPKFMRENEADNVRMKRLKTQRDIPQVNLFLETVVERSQRLKVQNARTSVNRTRRFYDQNVRTVAARDRISSAERLRDTKPIKELHQI